MSERFLPDEEKRDQIIKAVEKFDFPNTYKLQNAIYTLLAHNYLVDGLKEEYQDNTLVEKFVNDKQFNEQIQTILSESSGIYDLLGFLKSQYDEEMAKQTPIIHYQRVKVQLNYFVAENIRYAYNKHKDDINSPFTVDKLTEKYQVSRQVIRNILNGKTYNKMPKRFKPPNFDRNLKKNELDVVKHILRQEYDKIEDKIVAFDFFYKLISNPIISFLGYMPSKDKMKRIIKTMPKIKLKE